MARRRAVALVLLVVGFLALLIVPAGPARAQVDIPGITIPTPGNLLEELCPKRRPPAPQMPDYDVPWGKAGGETTFQKYGYAGLQITTYDQGCLAQVNASTASQVNELLNSVDALINAAQVSATSDVVVQTVDGVLPQALLRLRDAFWAPWMPTAAAVAGALMLAAAWSARSGLLATVGVNLLLVLAVVPWLLGNGQVVTGAADALTTGVAAQTSSALMELSPSQAGDTPAAAYGDAYYQIAWIAHVRQSFGSHDAAAEKYAAAFVETKAFSYAEMDAVAADPALEARLVEQKAKRWGELAEQLRAEYPAAFGTWADPQGAWGQVAKHAMVSVFAGSWVFVLSLAVLALRFLLRFGLLIMAALALVAVVRHQVTSALVGILATGLLAPPIVGLVSGGMLFWFYVVLADPQTAWWSAIVSGVALGIAALFALRFLGGAIMGIGAVSMAQGAARKGRSRLGHVLHRTASPATAAAAGAVAGATVTAAASSSPAAAGPTADSASSWGPPPPPAITKEVDVSGSAPADEGWRRDPNDPDVPTTVGARDGRALLRAYGGEAMIAPKRGKHELLPDEPVDS